METKAPERDAAPPEDEFLGVRIARLDVDGAAAAIAARPADRPFAYVVTPNAQHVVRLNRGDPDFGAGYAGAWLRLCDSQVMRRLARLFFGLRLPLASGSDVTAALFARFIQADDRLTIIGADTEIAERLAARYGTRNVAIYVPPMGFYRDPAEVARCVDFVIANPGRYVFLAVGAPQSECLALAIRDSGRATGVGLCVGSSLHFITGLVRRAPPLFRRAGLEWLYRLMLNPRRHARRVFVESLPLLGLVAAARVRGRRAAGIL